MTLHTDDCLRANTPKAIISFSHLYGVRCYRNKDGVPPSSWELIISVDAFEVSISI